jgi:hypothetical protein
MMAIRGRPRKYCHCFKQKEQRKQINSSKSMNKVQNMALQAKNKYTPYAVTQYHGVTAVKVTVSAPSNGCKCPKHTT